MSQQLFILSNGGALLIFPRHQQSRKRHSGVCNGGDVPVTINNTGCDPMACLILWSVHWWSARGFATYKKHKSGICSSALAVIRGSHTEPLPATKASLFSIWLSHRRCRWVWNRAVPCARRTPRPCGRRGTRGRSSATTARGRAAAADQPGPPSSPASSPAMAVESRSMHGYYYILFIII